MPQKVITTPINTKLAHSKFIEWLNLMINAYKSSFYDEAIQNIIQMSFIKKHKSFILELYQGEGRELSSFITILPTDTTDNILMVHNIGDGSPKYYNKTDGANLFEFDANGTLIRFYENITIPLMDSYGNTTMECYIVFEDWYGIKAPMFYVKSIGSNLILGKGFLDVPYEDKYSGSYGIENTPLANQPYFEITNISKILIVTNIPILTNLTIKYEIKAGHRIQVPITEWSEYHFKTMSGLGNLKINKVLI